MTIINHRRKNKKPVNQRFKPDEYNNGYAYEGNKRYDLQLAKEKAEYEEQTGQPVHILGEGRSGAPRIGRTDYLDKSMHDWGRKSEYANKTVGAGIGNDFTNGHRGMAKAVAGAKKFVRTRIRFAENQQLRKDMKEFQ